MHTGLYIFLGILSLSSAYNLTTNVTDGMPDFLNINTKPFVKIGNHYYHINTVNQTNWYAAFQACAELDAKLIHFESLEEWFLINNYLNDTQIDGMYWTSGFNKADEKTHVWFSNGKPISLDIWYPGEPNNKTGDEYCDELGHLYSPPKAFGLNDKRCTVNRSFICKIQQPKTASVVVW